MMSKSEIRKELLRLNDELKNPNISMWRELEAKGEYKALLRVLESE